MKYLRFSDFIFTFVYSFITGLFVIGFKLRFNIMYILYVQLICINYINAYLLRKNFGFFQYNIRKSFMYLIVHVSFVITFYINTFIEFPSLFFHSDVYSYIFRYIVSLTFPISSFLTAKIIRKKTRNDILYLIVLNLYFIISKVVHSMFFYKFAVFFPQVVFQSVQFFVMIVLCNLIFNPYDTLMFIFLYFIPYLLWQMNDLVNQYMFYLNNESINL
ncbi:hypothetical protein CWI38_0001p0200 [Hamiltosporidium tvaerminnensis]|uniref:Uncharacterized protein n=1 Tax=Hamiltosporidium tvaerminnensis TaxID=1176355 RepID=A0A4Q9M2U7_9MICR|nr:hypothetical protein CWI38_0001p0200 [Hamiltosporidium tvaerminnensis]